MQTMDISILKLSEDIKFPHQKIEINLGSLTNKVNIGEFIGLVYKDKEGKIKKIGVLCKVIGKISQIYLMNNLSYPMTISKLEVLFRIRILDDKKNIEKSQYFSGTVELIEDEIFPNEVKKKIQEENLSEKLKSEANKFFILNRIDIELRNQFNDVKLVFVIIPFLRLSGEEKQKFLEIDSLYDRMKSIISYFTNRNNQILTKNNEELARKNEARGNTEERRINNNFPFMNHNRRNDGILKEFEEKINKIKLPEEAKTIALDELEKLKSSKGSPEYDWTVTYLNTLLSLPWDNYTVDSNNIMRTKQILDRDHYGLDKVKKRIIEYLSVRKLTNKKEDTHSSQEENKRSDGQDKKTNSNNPKVIENNLSNLNLGRSGSILCFNGPPGVGKTSLAKSIADSLGKKFYRISLGGLKEVSEINGHRKTFIAAMPGMIIQALRRVNSKNPVILLDEIDKVGMNLKGDVSSSLLEVLDPEQNSTFKDHYINTTFDLSKVFFICTSNYLENVSPPLRDRLEIINISGYTPMEKMEICKKYLIPKQIAINGLINEKIDVKVDISDKIITDIILNFTFESGVRQLDRNIAAICRNIATGVVEEIERIPNFPNDINTKEKENELAKLNDSQIFNAKLIKNVVVTDSMLEEIFGKKRKEIDMELRLSSPGVAIGLAYTLNGGSLTLIESSTFNGNGNTILTGNMGDIMKESISTSVSWIKSNLNILGLTHLDLSKKDFHVHVPDAAVPKDGPSAGITISISLISLLHGLSVRKDTAMTGEMTLQGYVLPVGGIKEKCFAALRNNIKRVILSNQNVGDVEELPNEIKKQIKFIFVKDIKEVIKNAFYNVKVNEDGNNSISFEKLEGAKF